MNRLWAGCRTQEEGIQGREIKSVKSRCTEIPGDTPDPLRRENFQKNVGNVVLIERGEVRQFSGLFLEA